MKSKTILMTVLVATLLFSTAALAYPKGLGALKIFMLTKSFRMPLVEKNPTDWSVVEDGAWGLLQGKFGEYLMFDGHGLEPYTSYTLIHYIDADWPYAECIRSGIMTTKGGVTGNVVAYWPYLSYFDNDVDDKFWLVLSSDVNCESNEMIAWHPTEYLFEWDVI